jgi:protocatechuate 3,4-dioxygenase beta subunit
MRQYTPETITEAVIEQMATTPDPRMKAIMEAAVRHLHAFAREVELTPAEWIKGIEFMTKVGQMCTPARQEFILLSDTLGLSALVNIMHDKTKMEEATGASLLGPFFRENTPRFESGAQIAKATDGREVVLFGRVTNAQGAPLANAQVTVWQTAADGRYDIQNSLEEIDCRGIFCTDDKGNYLVRTVRPLGYFIPLDGPVGQMVMAQKRHGMRPAHIHFLISAPGYRELVTALYLAGDEHLEDDVVFGASGDLVAYVKENDPASPIKGLPSIHFDFSLSRETEADRLGGRVGGDPGAITKGNGEASTPYGAPPPEMAAAEQKKKGGILGGLFRGR